MENTKKEILHKDRGEEQPSPKGDQPSQPDSSASQKILPKDRSDEQPSPKGDQPSQPDSSASQKILPKDRSDEQSSPKGDQPSQPNSSASQNKTGRLAEIERAVEAHNAARRKRSVPPLEWSVHLAVKAESWAKNLCRRKIIERSGADGENLFWSWGDSDFADAVEAWLEEEQKYDGAKIGEGQAWTWKHFCRSLKWPIEGDEY